MIPLPDIAGSLTSRINDNFQVLKPRLEVYWVYTPNNLGCRTKRCGF